MGFKYASRQREIRDKLVEAARKGDFPSYGVFGDRVGIWNMMQTGDLLDAIANAEERRGLPDVTYVLHNEKYGLPSRIGRRPAKPPSDDQRRLAREKMQEVIDHYCAGTRNPY